MPAVRALFRLALRADPADMRRAYAEDATDAFAAGYRRRREVVRGAAWSYAALALGDAVRTAALTLVLLIACAAAGVPARRPRRVRLPRCSPATDCASR